MDDLQRLLKCPKPKTECADRALLDGALSGWKDEAYDLKRELNNGDPTDTKWLERPIKVELSPCGLGSLCLDNFWQYAQKYYNAAITFRRLMYTLIHYHAQYNPTNKDRNAYELAFRDITNGMYDTFKAKNHDYGNSFAELFKECGMTYAYGHMAEKLKRVKSLMSDEAKVKDESMKDSLLDLANYAILTIMELDKTRK